uniref:Uncharacterized protein n=1 Tax=viral metagenome TaxID=1070528 RepID=A0A6M3L1N9_9ZZZZ
MTGKERREQARSVLLISAAAVGSLAGTKTQSAFLRSLQRYGGVDGGVCTVIHRSAVLGGGLVKLIADNVNTPTSIPLALLGLADEAVDLVRAIESLDD